MVAYSVTARSTYPRREYPNRYLSRASFARYVPASTEIVDVVVLDLRRFPRKVATLRGSQVET